MNENKNEDNNMKIDTALWRHLTRKELRHLNRVLKSIRAIHESVMRIDAAWERARLGGDDIDLSSALEAEDDVLRFRFSELGVTTDRP